MSFTGPAARIGFNYGSPQGYDGTSNIATDFPGPDDKPRRTMAGKMGYGGRRRSKRCGSKRSGSKRRGSKRRGGSRHRRR